jgi:hypothetical protein
LYYDRKEISFVWLLHNIKDGGDVKMKKVFNKRILQIIGSMILFSISFILCHYTHLAALHGKSDAPIIVGILGIIALFISYIFNLKALTITATFGYIIAIFNRCLFGYRWYCTWTWSNTRIMGSLAC